MPLHGTKGIMGIGTLIIFIATILVAAVAAAVLISTSNVLQQRSLLVGSEARKAITDAVEVVSILAASDATTETFNNFEVLVRLSPGSDPLQMRTFNLQFISQNFDEAADLLYVENNTYYQVGLIENGTNTTVHDIDDDGTSDFVTLEIDAFGNNEGIKFWLSDEEVWSDVISLRKNISGASATAVSLSLDETPIVYNETIHGYVLVEGDTNTDDTVDESVNVSLFRTPSECTFALLPPETDYCYTIMNGNDDYVLGSGERFKLLYRLKDGNELTTGEDFQFIFTSEKGRLSEARARTPDVVTSTKAKLWPLG